MIAALRACGAVLLGRVEYGARPRARAGPTDGRKPPTGIGGRFPPGAGALRRNRGPGAAARTANVRGGDPTDLRHLRRIETVWLIPAVGKVPALCRKLVPQGTPRPQAPPPPLRSSKVFSWPVREEARRGGQSTRMAPSISLAPRTRPGCPAADLKHRRGVRADGKDMEAGGGVGRRGATGSSFPGGRWDGFCDRSGAGEDGWWRKGPCFWRRIRRGNACSAPSARESARRRAESSFGAPRVVAKDDRSPRGEDSRSVLVSGVIPRCQSSGRAPSPRSLRKRNSFWP